MNKRGISEIVSAVLLILLTIAAVAVVSNVVLSYINNKLKSGTECQAYNTGYFQFEQSIDSYNYNCYQESTSPPRIKYGFTVRSGEVESLISDKVLGFNVVLSNQTSSTTISLNSSFMSDKIQELEGSPGSYSLPNSGETRTYFYTLSTNPLPIYQKAESYVVLKSGKICDLSDKIQINKCGPGVILA